jgi:hypothetical protein
MVEAETAIEKQPVELRRHEHFLQNFFSSQLTIAHDKLERLPPLKLFFQAKKLITSQHFHPSLIFVGEKLSAYSMSLSL